MSQDQEMKRMKTIQNIVNDVSPSFCVAKYAQATWHLQTKGCHVHQCHHPTTEIVGLEELEADYKALGNSTHLKKVRKEMKEGVRTEECNYCWKVEDLDGYKSGEFYSDRITKSASNWSLGVIKEVVEGDPEATYTPSFLEVSFDNTCNLQCFICSSTHSSSIQKELDEHGPYPTSKSYYTTEEYLSSVGKNAYSRKEDNPNVEAFWKWWHNGLAENLKTLRLTGGEPLLHKDTYRMMEYINDNPEKTRHLNFSVNSNLMVTDSKINNFISKFKGIVDKVEGSHIYTSVDGSGAAAEYGRHGLKYVVWLANVDKILTELPNTKITIMSATNIASITSYKQLLADVLELKKKHSSPSRVVPITIDVAIVHHPGHNSVYILTDEYKTYMDDAMDFMVANKHKDNDDGFRDFEISRLARFIEYLKSSPADSGRDAQTNIFRADFYRFMQEHDRRRGTDFLKTFPEMANFYDVCKSNALKMPLSNIIKVKEIK